MKTHDVITDWQEAHLNYDNGLNSVAHITAPDGLLQAIHWRGRELSRFFKKILTPVTELYELRFELDEKQEV